MNFSNYLETAILDFWLKANSGNYSAPSAVYVGLADNNATQSEMEDSDFTHEITGYTGNRPQLTVGTISQNADGAAECSNTSAIDFENMPECTVKYIFVADSPTKGQGHILWWVELDPPKVVANAGDTFRIPTEGLKLQAK